MPRFEQVQKVNTSLCLLTSGLACINFHWHLNPSYNDPSRLLLGLLSNTRSGSRSDAALKRDPHMGLRRLAMPAKEVQPQDGAGLDAVVEWHHLQLSRAAPGPNGEAGKCVSLGWGEHFWAARPGAVCQTSKPQLVPGSRASRLSLGWNSSQKNPTLQRCCGQWQPKPRAEPHCAKHSAEVTSIWNLKLYVLSKTVLLWEIL